MGGMFSGDIDPEIANLVGITPSSPQSVPDFETLFQNAPEIKADKASTVISYTGENSAHEKTAFDPVKEFEQQPSSWFRDPEFYKKALSGEDEPAHRFHDLVSKFMKSTDPQEKAIFRQKLVPAYWELAASMSGKLFTGLPMEKILTLRFGAVLPALLSPEQRDMLSRVIFDNRVGEPLFYADEWLKAVGAGRVSPSATDETKQAAKDIQTRANSALDKCRGRYDAQLTLLRSRSAEMEAMVNLIQEKAQFLARHEVKQDLGNIMAPMTASQKQAATDIGEILRKMSTLDKELIRYHAELNEIRTQLESMKGKTGDGGDGDGSVDAKVVVREMQTIRQMAKLCIGRQGNHLPFLMKQYIRAELRNIGTRENILSIMADVERLDPGLFLRTFKQQTTRIVPNVVIVPCYGDRGICWEPFERNNKATSRGRIAIPLFPKELRVAVICALADLRWQVAKEKAQHYWMEEGLTGWYYQCFTERKMKGDLRETFIEDYILWITRESEGTQKLDRDVRDIFWRYIPYPQTVKDSLKNRGFVYSELCKKDLNRSMSDGY